ncbi:MAG: hypothetical protein PUD28_01620 [Lactobacillus sp.]|nr:hypothetical protein [Lactobacillus sp.]
MTNSAKYDYSNGPLKGINRKIKNLKRSCCSAILEIYCGALTVSALQKFPTSFLKQGIDLRQSDLTKNKKRASRNLLAL